MTYMQFLKTKITVSLLQMKEKQVIEWMGNTLRKLALINLYYITKGVLQVWVRVWLSRKIQRKENKVTRHKFQFSSSAKHSSALDLGSATLSNRQIVSRAVRLFGSNLPTKQLKNLWKQQLKRERPVHGGGGFSAKFRLGGFPPTVSKCNRWLDQFLWKWHPWLD